MIIAGLYPTEWAAVALSAGLGFLALRGRIWTRR